VTTLKNELEAKVAALRNEYQAAEKALEEETRVRTALPRSLVEDLEKRLALEQEFVAGIRKVPDEILVEILKITWGMRYPPVDWRPYAKVGRRYCSILRRFGEIFVHTSCSLRLQNTRSQYFKDGSTYPVLLFWTSLSTEIHSTNAALTFSSSYRRRVLSVGDRSSFLIHIHGEI
jgi:hypothetical protein